jgi:AraC family transcriptional regulator of adaptative response / DNA-3-methyladenine glycosylase II
VERIRAMFDLNADWAVIARGLASDPLLARRLQAMPGLHVPGCWNGFELAVRAIIGRHLDEDEANDLSGRMTRAFGRTYPAGDGLTHVFPDAAALAKANLVKIGFSERRADRIRALARAVSAGRIAFEGIVDSSAFLERLRDVTDIDEWTAQYVAMRALGEPDAFPAEGFALPRAGDAAKTAQRIESWRPWRAYAAMYLWNDAGGGSRPSRSADAAQPLATNTFAGLGSTALPRAPP